jgi:hypothetical protein
VERRAPDEPRLPRPRQALPQVQQPQAAAPDHHAIAMPAEVAAPQVEGAAPRFTVRVGGDTLLAGLFTVAMDYMAWQEGHERPGRALGYSLAGMAGAAFAIYTCIAPRGPEAEAGAGVGALLRRLNLRGQPLGDVIRSFCDGNSPAARFDWSTPGIFEDDLHNDQAAEVSHVLARAFRLARQNPALVPALQTFADQLACQPDLRKALASTVRDANATCDDRLGVSIGRLMLSGVLHQLRDPATPPSDVVHVLTLHAAMQAIHTRIFELLAQQAWPPSISMWVRRLLPAAPAWPPAPSAELLLLGSHAVQSGLREAGLAVPEVFPARQYLVEDVRRHEHRVKADALQIARTFAAPGGSAQLLALLQAHGGKEVDEILSARLHHHLEPVRERLLEHEPQGTSADALAAGGQQQEAYLAACQDLFIRAVDDALRGTGALWVAPGAATTAWSGASTRHAPAGLAAAGPPTAGLPADGPEVAPGPLPGIPPTR